GVSIEVNHQSAVDFSNVQIEIEGRAANRLWQPLDGEVRHTIDRHRTIKIEERGHQRRTAGVAARLQFVNQPGKRIILPFIVGEYLALYGTEEVCVCRLPCQAAADRQDMGAVTDEV